MPSKKYIIFILQIIYLFITCENPTLVKYNNLPGKNALIVLTSNNETGYFSLFDLSTFKFYKDIYPVHYDARAYYLKLSNKVAVLNGLLSDSIQIFNPENNYKLEQEISLGRLTNPQDLVEVSKNNIIISLHEKDQLISFNLINNKIETIIDLSHLSDADNHSEPLSLIISADSLFVALQRLNRKADPPLIWPPSDFSLIVQISLFDFSIISVIESFCPNIFTEFKFISTTKFYYSATGYFGANYKLDCGLEVFDLENNNVEQILTEIEIEAEILDIIIIDDIFAVAIIQFIQNKDLISSLVRIDLQLKKITYTFITLSLSDAGYLSGLAYDKNNNTVYTGDRSFKKPGLRAYSTISLKEKSYSPINTGLPPGFIRMIPQ